MATMNDDNPPPMAEPGTRPSGASTGGMRSTADAGLADALQRSSERGDDDAVAGTTTGEGLSGGAGSRTDLGGKDQPGSAPGTSGAAPAAPSESPGGTVSGGAAGGGAAGRTDVGQPLATAGHAPSGATPHEDLPEAPPDEGPLESLGRAMSEVVTGPLDAPVRGQDESRR